MGERSPGPKARVVAGAATVTTAVLFAGLLLLPAAAAVPTPLSVYNSGRVNVVFPSAFPYVTLIQDANSTVTATFLIQHVYELTPTENTDHPTVLGAAASASVPSFAVMAPPTAPGSPNSLTLAARIPVLFGGYPIWQGPPLPPSNLSAVSLLGTVDLTVQFSPLSLRSPAAGVVVNWSIGNWPWRDPSDSIAVEFALVTSTGSGFSACIASSLLFAAPPPCPGSLINPGESVFSPSVTSYESESAQGPTAAIAWGPTVAISGGNTAPVVAGGYRDPNGTDQVVLTSPALGAKSVNGTTDLVLLAPTVPPAVAKIVGNPATFVAAVGVFAVAAAGVLAAYRVHDRRIRRSL